MSSLALASIDAKDEKENVNDQRGKIIKQAPIMNERFFSKCAFVSVDFQPQERHHMTDAQLPEGWRINGFTAKDCNDAIDYLIDVALPNGVKVANACRELDLPMIFVHWGWRQPKGMDLAPDIRKSFLDQFGEDYSRWPHHYKDPSSRPAEEFALRKGEYVIAKTDQDSFTSSNIDFVLKNLGIENIVFVGGHTGACLGRTARHAHELGYKIICIEDATWDARESARLTNIDATPYDAVLTVAEFLAVTREMKKPH